eukprot:m.197218 g.197218  ORF g.197218 m.197218 type:complete len:845 (+) comp25869_c0_seq5:185-2719(+)
MFTLFFLLVVVGVCSKQVDVGSTRLDFLTPDIVRVTSFPGAPHSGVRDSLTVLRADWPDVDTHVTNGTDSVTITTSKLKVEVSLTTNQVSFSDVTTGKPILAESDRTFTPTTDLGKSSYVIEQAWKQDPATNESIYGLGQFQNGFIDFNLAPIKLVQFNTEAIVPFFVSTNGYGILWDNYANSFWNPPTTVVPMTAFSSGNANDQQKAHGKVTAGPGRVFFQIDCADGFGAGMNKYLNLTVNGVPVVWWNYLTNLPDAITGPIELSTSEEVAVELTYDGWSSPPTVYVVNPAKENKMQSSLGEFIDYYFVYGQSIDGSISRMRNLTGTAELFPKGLYGFIQCKEHYHTQKELIGAAEEFRSRYIPVDMIVQDWHYWGNLGWQPVWDPSIYPDPAGMVKQLHEMNYHFMVSVWSKFDNGTKCFKAMQDQNYLIPETIWFDPYNPGAREQFYNFSLDSMFSIGVDSLWLDATEPEGWPNQNKPVYLGSGNAYAMPYSLMVTTAIETRLAEKNPDQRIFLLTRSSFAGQQRTGGVLWSGDIKSDYDVMRRQVTAALNFQLSGMPYWTQDAGGFFRPKDQYTNPTYLNMLCRWFQFAALSPLFRVHGGGSNTEIWNYGNETMEHLNNTITLRYRMLPYTYSMASKIAKEHYTIMRALVMDFPADMVARQVGDEWMFGPSFLVAPILTNGTSRSVYVPKLDTGVWFDFWTGNKVAPGTVTANADISQIPLYVRSSIVVLGPKRQYALENNAGPYEVRVYAGADATFILYEDDGTTKDYLNGQQSFVPLTWDDKGGKLTIGQREGSGFPGQVTHFTVNVCFVAEGHGVGPEPCHADKTVQYTGASVVVSR